MKGGPCDFLRHVFVSRLLHMSKDLGRRCGCCGRILLNEKESFERSGLPSAILSMAWQIADSLSSHHPVPNPVHHQPWILPRARI